MPLSAQIALRGERPQPLNALNWFVLKSLSGCSLFSWLQSHVTSEETLLFLIVNLNLEGIELPESLSVRLDRPPPLSVVYLSYVLTARDKMQIQNIGFGLVCVILLYLWLFIAVFNMLGSVSGYSITICLIVIIKIVYICTLMHQTLIWWNLRFIKAAI